MLVGLGDLGLQGGQEGQIAVHHGPGDQGLVGRDGHLGGGHQPLGHRAQDLHAPLSGGLLEPGHPERVEPGRVGELGQHQPADLGPEQAGDTATHAGEGPVNLAQELVLERGPGRDPPFSMRHPGGQLAHDRRQPSSAGAVPSPQQVADRHQVQRVGLDPPPSGQLPLGGHLVGLTRTSCQPAGRTPVLTRGW
jgi:hypothetical protein